VERLAEDLELARLGPPLAEPQVPPLAAERPVVVGPARAEARKVPEANSRRQVVQTISRSPSWGERDFLCARLIYPCPLAAPQSEHKNRQMILIHES
jgi:hypothetical protein